MTKAKNCPPRLPAGAAKAGLLPDGIDWPSTIPFALAHVACLGAIWTGVSTADVAAALLLFWGRMFGITAGYHRYFAHRTFRTGRVFQFLLAVLAQSSAQRGVLWWAATHRDHHKYSDTERDPHSPVKKGFWRAHFGWFFEPGAEATDLARIPDFARYPELVWLDRHPYLPAVGLAAVCWLIGGWSMLVVGFFWSTVALWHATFSINSLAHLVGRRRYVTGDSSRNNWWLALLTFGEGWHNNHHYYPSSVRQGFRRHEIDITWMILRLLRRLRLVWDFETPPAAVIANRRRLPDRALNRAADELLKRLRIEERLERLRSQLAEAGSSLAERRAALQTRLSHTQAEALAGLDELRARWRDWSADKRAAAEKILAAAENRISGWLPSRSELKRRAERMFADARAVEAVARQAERRLAERLAGIVEEIISRPAARQA